MVTPEPKPRWYRPTPDRMAVMVLLAQGGLILADRFYLFGLRRGDLWNVQLAAGLVVGMLGLGLLWLLVGLVLRRRRQFGIRWLMLLTLTVAVPSSWYAVWKEQGRQQQEALAAIQQTQARILEAGKAFRQPSQGSELISKQPGPREIVVGVSFSVEEDLGCGCCFGIVPTDVSDKDLAPLAHFYALERLELPNAEVADAGLVHLRNLRNLRYLDLTGNPITDAGLVHLRGLKNLEELSLSRTDITDAGFVHLAAMRSLKRLNFGNTPATGKGVTHLADCKALTRCGRTSVYSLGGYVPIVDPEGACAFNQLPHLEELSATVARPGTSDASIEFDGHPKLRKLFLGNGMHLESIRLANLPALESASFDIRPCIHRLLCGSAGPLHKNTPVCKTCLCGVDELRLENLPKLKQLHFADVKRFVLRDVPNLADVTLRGEVEREHFRQLGRSTQLESLTLYIDELPSDDALAELGPQPRLQSLIIRAKGLTDVSLAALANFPALRSLSLGEAELTGEGFKHLRHLKSLERLHIDKFSVSGEPPACLSELSQLKSVSILRAEIGTLRLIDLPNLETVSLEGCQIGTLEVVNLPMLKRLGMTGSHGSAEQVTAKRLPQLQCLNLRFWEGKKPLRHVELEQLPKLVALYVPGKWKLPMLTDDCFENIGTFTNLQSLDISNSRVTDRTIERLRDLPCLKEVDLHNTRTTEAAADRLRANGPEGIKVIQSGPRK